MRCELVLAALAGCAYTDVDAPIGVVATGLSDADTRNLYAAAQCWNLEVGVQFVTGPAALDVPQQVEVFYDETSCLVSLAQTQAGTPASIGICPERYWDGLPNAGVYASLAQIGLGVTPFRVLSHELGHVLNIVGHPSAKFAVMRAGGFEGRAMFDPADLAAFHDANPDFAIASACTGVRRWHTADGIGHCTCETTTELDLRQPIAIATPPYSVARAVALENYIDCFNLHYGTHLAIAPGAAPVQVVELLGQGCPIGRVFDGAHVYACDELGPEAALASALAVSLFPRRIPPVFDTAQDMAVHGRYPYLGIACQMVARDPATGVCSCNDGVPSPRPL